MKTATHYEICVEGHLPDHWSEWFEGLVIRTEPDGCTTLAGPLADQSALMGVLNRITALNIPLVSVQRGSRGDAPR